MVELKICKFRDANASEMCLSLQFMLLTSSGNFPLGATKLKNNKNNAYALLCRLKRSASIY